MCLFAAIIDQLNSKIVPERAAASSSDDDEEKKWRQYVIFSSASFLCLYSFIHVWIKWEEWYDYTVSRSREGCRLEPLNHNLMAQLI